MSKDNEKETSISNLDVEEMAERSQVLAQILKKMSHPERLVVLCQLVEGEMGVAELQKRTTLSQSAFSQHLALLRKQGIVKVRKEAHQVFYSLADSQVACLLTCMHKIFCKNCHDCLKVK